MRTFRTNRASDGGSALILALWIVILLSLIVGFFAFEMHIEARITSYCRKRLKADYLAKAAVERARQLLVKCADPNIKKDDAFKDKDAPWYPYAKHLAFGGSVEGYSEELDGGTLSLAIVPEPALRNVNRLDQNDWERIFDVAGIPEESWDDLIDSFEDWKDADNIPRRYGAETEDYYKTLNPPYQAKNGPLFTVEELLLIKGFAPAMLYGGLPEDAAEDDTPMSGMRDLLTVYGDGKVNVNAASERVLMTLPSVDELAAQGIIDERTGTEETDQAKDKSFESEADFFTRFPTLRAPLQNRIIAGSEVYRITATGNSHGVAREISCIASVNRSTGVMTVLRWTESDL